MGKPHYYQKVINSQPPLIFVCGVARFELLRRLPPTFLKFSVKPFWEPRKKRQFPKPANPCGSSHCGLLWIGIGAKSANAFLLPRFRCIENRPKTVKNAWGYLYLPVLLRGHTAAYGGKHGASLLCVRLTVGWYNKPEETDVRVYSVRPLPPASRPRRAAWSFPFLSKLRLVRPVLRAFPCVRGEGWYHYPQRTLRAAETPDGRLLKWLICCFLRLGSHHGIFCNSLLFADNVQFPLYE